MKRNRKILFIAIAAAVLLCIAVLAVGATLSGGKTATILSAIINGEEYSEDNDLNGDGEIDVLDAILAIKQGSFKGPKLTTLMFDDEDYSIDFKATETAYTVFLPAGRPRIPLVVATADEGIDVDIQQATIADTEKEGVAKVTVVDDSGKNTYVIKFVKEEVVDTVVLQYDDRWTFTPDYTLAEGESFTFVSSDATVVSVDGNGVLTAEKVSDTPVTVKAMVGDAEKDALTVSAVHKAQINLFFVTGQSNAQGCYDYDTSYANNIEYEDQIKVVEQPETSGRVYSFDVYPRQKDNPEAYAVKGTLYDMAEIKRQGFASALGKTYYNLSGEKVVFLQSAYSGAPIERWLDPDVHSELAESNTNHYDATQTGYATLMGLLTEDTYEIRSRANFWLQGETCMSQVWDYDANNWGGSPTGLETLFNDQTYATYFLYVHEQMKKDFGIEMNNILLVRAHGSEVPNADGNVMAALNEVRAAQYGMANTYDDITIVSRLSDYTVRYNEKYVGTVYEPYNGTMGVKNVHYNQTGHNINGRIAATNYFYSLDADTNTKATSVEIINTDGIERLNSDTTFEIAVGRTKRIAAFALPETSLENVTYSSSDENVAKISIYGLITAMGEGDAVITATSESGVKASIKVKVVANPDKTFHYRWDFNGDLTSSADANDLSLTALSIENGAEGNYSFTKNGNIYVDGSLADLNKPNFKMTFPVTINDELDWSIEWKGDMTAHSVLLGQENCHLVVDGKNKYVNHIYSVFSTTDLSKFPVKYPLRLTDSQGNNHFLSYTSTYYAYTIKDYAWKLDYTKQAGKITLSIFLNDEWTYVDSIEMTDFEFVFDTIFGRYDEKGLVNYEGWCDYIDIKTSPAKVYEDVHYRWDFNDTYLESTYDSNQLTPTALSVTNSATATVSGGIVKTSGAQEKRMNYKMENEVILTRESDWSIEWRSKFSGGSILLGQEESSQNKNVLYAAYTTAAAGYEYGLKLDDDYGHTLTLPFGATAAEAKALCTAWNTFKLEYTVSTNTLALKLYDAETDTWTVINSLNPTKSQFEKVTYTTLFGRYNVAGLVNFIGEMDYMDIQFKRAVEETAVEYFWEFTDLASSSDANTLTPTADSKYSLENGIYATTTRAGELALEKPITLDSSSSWTIEWRYMSTATQSNSLFGTECCTNSAGKTFNHFYLAAGTYTGDFESPARLHFANGMHLDLQFVKGATSSTPARELVKVWNTWRLRYDKPTRTLSLELYDAANATWNVCDSAVMGGFSMTFTHMFGDFGSKAGPANTVNMNGNVDYVKVNFTEKAILN